MYANSPAALSISANLRSLAAEVAAFELVTVIQPAPAAGSPADFVPAWASDDGPAAPAQIDRSVEFRAWLQDKLAQLVEALPPGDYDLGVGGDIGDVLQKRQDLKRAYPQSCCTDEFARKNRQAHARDSLLWLAEFLEVTAVSDGSPTSEDVQELHVVQRAAQALEPDRRSVVLQEGQARMSASEAVNAWQHLVESLRALLAERHTERNLSVGAFAPRAKIARELVETVDDMVDSFKANPVGTHRGLLREFANDLSQWGGSWPALEAASWKDDMRRRYPSKRKVANEWIVDLLQQVAP